MYTPEDFSFLQVAIYLGLFSPKEGKIFLEERARLFREGQDLPLSRLLLKKGRLGPSQIKEIEGWMRDGYFFCTHCKALYPPSRSVAPRQVCSQCKRAGGSQHPKKIQAENPDHFSFAASGALCRSTRAATSKTATSTT